MEKLRQAQLKGHGLTRINSPLLVGRYNACLEALGAPPTSLTDFNIDGLGWSPEIAAEKNDKFYLFHGEANQFAIIVGPAQYNKPVYFSYYSFNRLLMKSFFDRYYEQILKVTEDTAVWLDIDQDLTRYVNPQDLLMVDSITVRVETLNGISTAAKDQRQLVRKFLREKGAWFDAALREQIIASARTHGDLRFKNVVINDFRFSDIRSFFTLAFGGMYVFRDFPNGRQYLLILIDEEKAQTYASMDPNVYSIKEPGLLGLLKKCGLVCEDVAYYQQSIDDLEIKRQCMLAEALSRERPDVCLLDLSAAQVKKHIKELSHALPDEFAEIERLMHKLKNDTCPKSGEISWPLRQALHYPDLDLPRPVRDVVRHLLCELDPSDIFLLYVYNKDKFFDLYEDWPETKQRWAIELVKSKYHARMDTEPDEADSLGK